MGKISGRYFFEQGQEMILLRGTVWNKFGYVSGEDFDGRCFQNLPGNQMVCCGHSSDDVQIMFLMNYLVCFSDDFRICA